MLTSSRCLLGMMKMCSLCCVAPALCQACQWPIPAPLSLGITKSAPNSQMAEELIWTQLQIARRCSNLAQLRQPWWALGSLSMWGQ